jgi:predicted transcriptional regulator
MSAPRELQFASEVALADLVADIKASFVAARSGAKAEEDGRATWRDNTLKLAKALLAGRELHQNDNNAFGAWLDASGLGEDFISDKDRWALIKMAEHPQIAERILATTSRRSWRHIWAEEIAHEVEAEGVSHVGNTPSNRGGRPRCPHLRKTPVPSADPIDDVVSEAIAKFADPKAEWRTVPRMAQILMRAESAVREALKRLNDDGLLEQRKTADGIGIEYRINGEPKDDLRRELAEAHARIAELIEENAELKLRIARLEEQLGEGGAEPNAPVTIAEQLEQLEKEEAEQVAPPKPTHH